jgi:hypothetical protein
MAIELCEWDPERSMPACEVGGKYYSGCKNEANQSVGRAENWHLCDSCAALPRFKKFRYRVRLGKAVNSGDRV